MVHVGQVKGERLWKFDLAQLRREFLRIVPSVGLSKWSPVLYMARHTGASLDRLEQRISLEEVRRRGRWLSEGSVRRYEKRALIQEVYASLTANQRQLCHRADERLISMLRRKFAGAAV